MLQLGLLPGLGPTLAPFAAEQTSCKGLHDGERRLDSLLPPVLSPEHQLLWSASCTGLLPYPCGPTQLRPSCSSSSSNPMATDTAAVQDAWVKPVDVCTPADEQRSCGMPLLSPSAPVQLPTREQGKGGLVCMPGIAADPQLAAAGPDADGMACTDPLQRTRTRKRSNQHMLEHHEEATQHGSRSAWQSMQRPAWPGLSAYNGSSSGEGVGLSLPLFPPLPLLPGAPQAPLGDPWALHCQLALALAAHPLHGAGAVQFPHTQSWPASLAQLCSIAPGPPLPCHVVPPAWPDHPAAALAEPAPATSGTNLQSNEGHSSLAGSSSQADKLVELQALGSNAYVTAACLPPGQLAPLQLQPIAVTGAESKCEGARQVQEHGKLQAVEIGQAAEAGQAPCGWPACVMPQDPSKPQCSRGSQSPEHSSFRQQDTATQAGNSWAAAGRTLSQPGKLSDSHSLPQQDDAADLQAAGLLLLLMHTGSDASPTA
ncbi:hypothetical protein V8C86DRAFT_1805749 [Haematococcus lacustris]